jgi:hypothetical protein
MGQPVPDLLIYQSCDYTIRSDSENSPIDGGVFYLVSLSSSWRNLPLPDSYGKGESKWMTWTKGNLATMFLEGC